MSKIIYVCNCCGRENINPETLSQIPHEDRTLHQCEECQKIRGPFYPVEKFDALSKYDVIIEGPGKADVYTDLKNAGCEIDNHESDLYVKATAISFQIIKAHGLNFDGIQAGQFWHQETRQRWFEIPFAYAPYWERKARLAKK